MKSLCALAPRWPSTPPPCSRRSAYAPPRASENPGARGVVMAGSSRFSKGANGAGYPFLPMLDHRLPLFTRRIGWIVSLLPLFGGPPDPYDGLDRASLRVLENNGGDPARRNPGSDALPWRVRHLGVAVRVLPACGAEVVEVAIVRFHTMTRSPHHSPDAYGRAAVAAFPTTWIGVVRRIRRRKARGAPAGD